MSVLNALMSALCSLSLLMESDQATFQCSAVSAGNVLMPAQKKQFTMVLKGFPQGQ